MDLMNLKLCMEKCMKRVYHCGTDCRGQEKFVERSDCGGDVYIIFSHV